MADFEEVDRRTSKCLVCKHEAELVTCKQCTENATIVMVHRMMEEKPDEIKTQRMLKEIIDELRYLRETLSDFRIKGKGLALKPKHEDLF